MYNKDPYEVMGVSPQAGDDEIKRVYRELIRKYHPDNYAGADSTLVELANEKFQEVQAAYNEIMERRSLGDYSGGVRGQRGNQGSYNGNPYGNVGQGNYGGSGVYGQGNYNGSWQQPYQRNYQSYGNSYGRPANYSGGGGCGTGNLCCDLWCADTLCECMGGDMIRCI